MKALINGQKNISMLKLRQTLIYLFRSKHKFLKKYLKAVFIIL